MKTVANNSIAKALWYIESHFAADISLEQIAAVSGVSRFHLSRVFSMAIGQSVIGYVRGRRLTTAAHALASGAPDILALALDSGYSSHEAFTRAFREQFGLTPEAVRMRGDLDNMELVEAIRMTSNEQIHLEEPRFEQGRALLIAGLSERLGCGDGANIPAMWQHFGPYIGNIAGQVGRVAYGVIFNSDDAGNVEYLCGVEVADFSGIAPELQRLRLPEQYYAVFYHREHVSTLNKTCVAIMSEWLPQSKYEAVDAPFFEKYGESFDPRTGNGGVEVWVPIRR